MALTDLPVRELLERFSSSDPTPGGGSAAALASAVGGSLLMMVASLPKTRSGSDDDRNALEAVRVSVADIARQLTEAIDADSIAYDHVVAAYKMAKGTVEEKSARKAAIQGAMRSAVDVPLRVMRLSALALADARTVAERGTRTALSDVGVAIGLLLAGLRGARLNVEINLPSLQDASYVADVTADVERLTVTATSAAAAAEGLLTS